MYIHKQCTHVLVYIEYRALLTCMPLIGKLCECPHKDTHLTLVSHINRYLSFMTYLLTVHADRRNTALYLAT